MARADRQASAAGRPVGVGMMLMLLRAGLALWSGRTDDCGGARLTAAA